MGKIRILRRASELKFWRKGNYRMTGNKIVEDIMGGSW
jgi:hypothetical protein